MLDKIQMDSHEIVCGEKQNCCEGGYTPLNVDVYILRISFVGILGIL